METKFDAKTRTFAPGKIWDVPPRFVFELGELKQEVKEDRYRGFTCPWDFVEKLGEMLKCVARLSADQTGDEGKLRAIFSVPIPESKHTHSVRMGIKHGALLVASMPALLPELEALGGRLKSIGLEIGEPEIIISHYCSY
jgi:hypothetical protein